MSLSKFLFQNAALGGTGTINEEHIRMSLLSAVEDKLRRRLEDQYAQSRAELDILQQSGTELAQGKQRLETIIERLDSEKVSFNFHNFAFETKKSPNFILTRK